MKELFTDSQLDKLSDILIVIGEVLFASIVVPFFFGLDKMETTVIGLAVVATVVCWLFSVAIVKRGEEK